MMMCLFYPQYGAWQWYLCWAYCRKIIIRCLILGFVSPFVYKIKTDCKSCQSCLTFHLRVAHFFGILKRKRIYPKYLCLLSQNLFPQANLILAPNYMCLKLVYCCPNRPKRPSVMITKTAYMVLQLSLWKCSQLVNCSILWSSIYLEGINGYQHFLHRDNQQGKIPEYYFWLSASCTSFSISLHDSFIISISGKNQVVYICIELVIKGR